MLNHTLPVHALSWHPTADHLVTACDDGVTVWDVYSGDILTKVTLKSILCVAWFPKEDVFVCGNSAGTLYVFTSDGDLMHEHKLGYRYAAVCALNMVSDHQLVVVAVHYGSRSASHDLIRLSWNNGELVSKWTEVDHSGEAKMSPIYDDKYVVVGSAGKDVVDCVDVWSRRTVKQYPRMEVVKRSCTCALIGLKLEYMVGGDGSDVVLWGRDTAKRVQKLTGHSREVSGIAVHPQNPLEFVSYSVDTSFIVWRFGKEEDVQSAEYVTPDKLATQVTKLQLEEEQLQKEIELMKQIDELKTENDAMRQLHKQNQEHVHQLTVSVLAMSQACNTIQSSMIQLVENMKQLSAKKQDE
jgi:WD40 repeat protein